MPYRWLETAFVVIAGRGIAQHEVIEVLASGRRRVVPAHDPQGLSLLSVWGRTASGRALIVVVRPTGVFDAVVIGARTMSDKEREEFQAWETSR